VIAYDMPAEEYHASQAVSNSMLSTLAISPAHCYALHIDPQRPERKPTKPMSLGNLAHAMILEPHTVKNRFVVKPPGMTFSTKAGKAFRDSVAQGASIVSTEEFNAAQHQRNAVMRVAILRELLSSGKPEVSLFWTDAATGLQCKARPDWLHFTNRNKVIALDLKTISELGEKSVDRAITAYGYHRQRAHYVNGLRACGLNVEEFGFAFVTSSYPYIAVAHLLDDETLNQGHDEIDELLSTFADCTKTGHWPAFGDGFQPAGLMHWARRSQEVEVSYVD
jgi:hypothetical protein